MRMEHIHTLSQPWSLEDDFQRVLAWQSLGVDDVLDVSVPWSTDPEVGWEDSTESGPEGTILVRKYRTPSGRLTHKVRQTGEDPGAGWVIQPDHVPLIEDFNIPRAVRHAVTCAEDVPRCKTVELEGLTIGEHVLTVTAGKARPVTFVVERLADDCSRRPVPALGSGGGGDVESFEEDEYDTPAFIRKRADQGEDDDRESPAFLRRAQD